MKHVLKIYVLLALLLSSCTKDSEEKEKTCAEALPPETTTGANTFGCCINGRLLIPRDGTGSTMGDDDGFSFWGGYPSGAYNEIEIIDYKSEKTGKLLLHIHQLQAIGLGTYVINESNGMSNIDGLNHTYLHCKIFDEKTNSYQWYRSYENSGTLKITRFDWGNGIISGTFACRVRNSANPNDEIEILMGRFDMNGYTLPNKNFP